MARFLGLFMTVRQASPTRKHTVPSGLASTLKVPALPRLAEGMPVTLPFSVGHGAGEAMSGRRKAWRRVWAVWWRHAGGQDNALAVLMMQSNLTLAGAGEDEWRGEPAGWQATAGGATHGALQWTDSGWPT